MTRLLGTGLTLLSLICSAAAGVAHAAQGPPPPPPRQGPQNPGPRRGGPPPPPLRIFLDCYQCDTDHLRRNVAFVEYVRDRNVADLHVLVTTQSTGGGGQAWTVKFIGLGRFAGLDRTLTFTTGQTATSDEQRREFARVFRIGLIGYAADTPMAPRLDVTFRRPPPASGPGATGPDPWRGWVFRTNASGSLSGEDSSDYYSYRLSLTANRVTAGWKLNFTAGSNYNENVFHLTDRDITSITESWNASTLIVKSLTGKWSWGSRASISNSSFSNTERASAVSTGIEYDFFPYSQSNRRSLTLQYLAGATAYTYREVTIFDKLDETVPHHSINMSLGLRQPWGSVGSSASWLQHLNHRDRYRISVYGNADVRVFKGFSLYTYANYSKIQDQIALRKGAATPEEILLRIRQQATNYSYSVSLGFSYSFGSIFTSVVNPRFNGVDFFF